MSSVENLALDSAIRAIIAGDIHCLTCSGTANGAVMATGCVKVGSNATIPLGKLPCAQQFELPAPWNLGWEVAAHIVLRCGTRRVTRALVRKGAKGYS